MRLALLCAASVLFVGLVTLLIVHLLQRLKRTGKETSENKHVRHTGSHTAEHLSIPDQAQMQQMRRCTCHLLNASGHLANHFGSSHAYEQVISWSAPTPWSAAGGGKPAEAAACVPPSCKGSGSDSPVSFVNNPLAHGAEGAET